METQGSGACRREESTCSNANLQYIDVSLPIQLKPYAAVGNLNTKCCGNPVVTHRFTQTGGLELMITQTVCITIPVEYGTISEVGETGIKDPQDQNCNNLCYR